MPTHWKSRAAHVAEGPKFTCPRCGGQDSRVIETRPLIRTEGVRRRRKCTECGDRYSTHEVHVRRDTETSTGAAA